MISKIPTVVVNPSNCPEKFNNVMFAELKRRKLLHEKVRPFECDECSGKFSHKSGLGRQERRTEMLLSR